jgi:hypothetical protein
MSRITLSGNASGTGNFTLASPNSNTDRTLTLPDATGTVVTDSATQTLTNKTIQGGALTLGTAVASTSGTAIDFTGIPSWAKRVTVMFAGVSTNGTSVILVQLGTSGGFATTGYVAIGAAIGGTLAVNDFSTGFAVSEANTAASLYGGMIQVSNITGSTWAAIGSFRARSGVGSFASGTVTTSGTLDRVRITTANGTDTFDAGTINISYEG